MTCTRKRAARSDGGFTIIELTVALGLLMIVSASLAPVFYAAVRAAGTAEHRTDAASLASREIERMRAVAYAAVGFYGDQYGYPAGGKDTLLGNADVVTLGSVSSAANPPLLQPATPDPSAGGLSDPDPANGQPVVLGHVSFSVARHIVWVNAKDSAATYAGAYKQLTVIVGWSDTAGTHSVRQDSILYPGGQGKYAGPEGVATSTTTTVPAVPPPAPNLGSIPNPTADASLSLSWSMSSTAGVTKLVIEYDTNAGLTNPVVTPDQPATETSFTLTGLSPNTTYFVAVVAYSAGGSTMSNVRSQTTLSAAGGCTFGPLTVQGATALSTTGTKLTKSGKMSENLKFSFTTTGSCTHPYKVVGTAPPPPPPGVAAPDPD